MLHDQDELAALKLFFQMISCEFALNLVTKQNGNGCRCLQTPLFLFVFTILHLASSK